MHDQHILTKERPHRKGGGLFFHGRQCNVRRSVGSIAAGCKSSAVMPLLRTMILSLHTPQQRFPMFFFRWAGQPPKLPPPFWPPLIHCSLGPHESAQLHERHLDRFIGFAKHRPIHVANAHSHRQTQTTLRATSIAIGRIYTTHAMWPDYLSDLLYLCLCHSDWLFHRDFCPCFDVVHPGHVWSSSPACTWHYFWHYLCVQATPLFFHGATTVC